MRARAQARLDDINADLDQYIMAKNDQWYSLIGFIYSLVKLGFSEEFLLSRSPIEIILIASKARDIESEIAENMRQQQAAAG